MSCLIAAARKRTQNNQPPNTIDNTINNNGGRGASNHLGSNNIHGIGQNFNNNGPKGANNHIGSNMAPGIGANNFGINNDGGFNGHGPAIGHNAISNGLGNSHTSNGQGVRQNSNGFGNGLKSINHGNGQNSLDPGNWHNSNSLGNELNSNSNGFGNEPNSNGHGNRPNLNSNGNGHNSNSNSFQSSVQNHGSGSPGAGRRGLEIIFVDLGSHSRLLPTATIGDQTHANSAQHPSIPSAVDIFNHPKELQINNGANLNQRVVSPDVAPAQRLFQVQLPSGQSEFYLINPIHPVGNNTAKNALSLTAAGGRKGTATASNSVTVTKSFLGMEDVVTTAQPAEEPPRNQRTARD
ncbi:hypothetical protein DPMN_031127 [Dreissena polymorpha]|uniref:Uncharacterized protein n=1 Tax=Dreissena polymorpha TaxID=45954 RepID=A0A9D4RGT8_DREPO|nr:hypothetical protein DPMN_031127 [Dreissena polymorpha]